MSNYPGPPGGRPPMPGQPGSMQNQMPNQMPGPPTGMPSQPPRQPPHQMMGPKGNIPPPMMNANMHMNSGQPPQMKGLPTPNIPASQPASFNGVGGMANHVGQPQAGPGTPPRPGPPGVGQSPQGSPYSPPNQSPHYRPGPPNVGPPVSQHGGAPVQGQGYPRPNMPGFSHAAVAPPPVPGKFCVFFLDSQY